MDFDWQKLLGMVSPLAGMAMGGPTAGGVGGAMGQGGLLSSLGSLFGGGPQNPMSAGTKGDFASPPQMEPSIAPAYQPPPAEIPNDPFMSGQLDTAMAQPASMGSQKSLFPDDEMPLTMNEQANLDAVSKQTPAGPPPPSLADAMSSVKAPPAPEGPRLSPGGIPQTGQNPIQDYLLSFLMGKGAAGGGEAHKSRAGLGALLA